MKRTTVTFAALILALATTTAHAELVTYYFTGHISPGYFNPVVNSNDTFSGSYTFDTTVTPRDHPELTLDNQAICIHPDLPGTGWTLRMNSTAVAPFDLAGDLGSIAVGNDTEYGDRYIITLHNIGALPLPLDGTLSFFQLDLQDFVSLEEAELLVDDSYASLPNLSQASYSGGRFVTSDYGEGYAQCFFVITSLTDGVVPEPSTFALLSIGLLSIGGYATRKRRPGNQSR